MTALEVSKEIKVAKKLEPRLIAGILIIIAAVINIIARIDIGTRGWTIDGIITLIIFVSGIVLLKFDKWLPFGAFGFACSIIGIFYPIIKLYIYCTIMPVVTELSSQELLPVGLPVFITTSAISVCAVAFILTWKFSKK
ncbi:MAG: hypothetical protein QMD21_03850 [Candidatus Thermoplasmatota archaeon]|nr:hypothetical protein [Candidatus Thermoplasmatota archaeon]MDI6887810.1 hypothetical protein [Candidatus Thermoplasmatota archaeon]